jgi:hypothetical protein
MAGPFDYSAFEERLCELELPVHLRQFFRKLTLTRKAKSGLYRELNKHIINLKVVLPLSQNNLLRIYN